VNAKNPVKDVILEKSIELFNSNGFVNVRLQHIADHANISVGHLAYHYRNKEAILEAVYDKLKSKQRIHFAEYRVVPLFMDVERQIASTYQLQHEYLFFYLDMLEIMRGYPTIREAHQEQIQWHVLQIQAMIDFNVSRGAFQPAVRADHHLQVAKQYWLNTEFWLYSNHVSNSSSGSYDDYRTSMWGVLMPLFTHVGFLEYDQLGKVSEDFDLR